MKPPLAPSEGAGAPDIKITMIEAGADILADYDYGYGLIYETVGKILRVAAPKQRKKTPPKRG
jgi:hypothetical protein